MVLIDGRQSLGLKDYLEMNADSPRITKVEKETFDALSHIDTIINDYSLNIIEHILVRFSHLNSLCEKEELCSILGICSSSIQEMRVQL